MDEEYSPARWEERYALQRRVSRGTHAMGNLFKTDDQRAAARADVIEAKERLAVMDEEDRVRDRARARARGEEVCG